MSRFIKIGGAATGLILVHTAYAAENFSVTLSGTVPRYCNILSTGAAIDRGSGAVTGSSSHSIVTFDSSFADLEVNGHETRHKGHGTTQVRTNIVCKLTLVSANGALWNSASKCSSAVHCKFAWLRRESWHAGPS